MKKLTLIFLISLVFFVKGVEGQTLTQEQVNEYALKETQKQLTSEPERKKLIEKDPKAKAADDAVVKAVGSGRERDELYNMAATYMKTLSEKTDGNTDMMKQEMLKAAKDPETFMKSLPPEMQRRIREIASTMEKKHGIKKDAPPQP